MGRLANSLVALGWLLGATLLVGCDTIQQEDHFEFEVVTGVTVGATTPTNALLTMFPTLPGLTDVDLSTTQGFTQRGHAASEVEALRLADCVIAITETPGQDLSFLGELRVVAQAEGEPDKLIARLGAFEPGFNRAVLETTDDDLQAWLIGHKGRVTLLAARSQRPQRTTHLELRLTFEVDVKVL